MELPRTHAHDVISNTYFKMAILLWHCLTMYVRTRDDSILFEKGVSPIFETKNEPYTASVTLTSKHE